MALSPFHTTSNCTPVLTTLSPKGKGSSLLSVDHTLNSLEDWPAITAPPYPGASELKTTTGVDAAPAMGNGACASKPLCGPRREGSAGLYGPPPRDSLIKATNAAGWQGAQLCSLQAKLKGNFHPLGQVLKRDGALLLKAHLVLIRSTTGPAQPRLLLSSPRSSRT